MKYKLYIKYFIFCATFFIFGVNTTMADFFSSPLSSDWQARFTDVKVLNNYAKDHQVKLADVEIKKYNIDGANIPSGLFENTQWQEIQVQNSRWGKVTFRNSKLESVDFSGATIDEMVFENTTLINVKFSKAQLNNVKFIDSELKYTSFWSITNSTILFDRSKLHENNLGDSQANLSFKESSLFDSDFRGMKSPSSLSFENSQLEEVNLSHATLEKLLIVDSNIHETTFDKGTADRIEINDSVLHMDFVGTRAKTFVINRTEFTSTLLNHSILPNIKISYCKKVKSLSFFEAKVGTLTIDNCPLNNFRLRSAQIESLVLENSSLENSKFEEMKAQNVTFRKVELKGTLNFTGATIENLKTEGLTKAPGLRLITEGGNVKF